MPSLSEIVRAANLDTESGTKHAMEQAKKLTEPVLIEGSLIPELNRKEKILAIVELERRKTAQAWRLAFITTTLSATLGIAGTVLGVYLGAHLTSEKQSQSAMQTPPAVTETSQVETTVPK